MYFEITSVITLVYIKLGIPEFLGSGCRSWTLDPGRWSLDARLWTLDAGLWKLDSGRWVLDSGRWTLDVGCYTLDAGLWAPNPIVGCFRTKSEASF